MTKERWTKIQCLYEATNKLPPDEQSAFLWQACGLDVALFADVISLVNIKLHRIFRDRKYLGTPAQLKPSGTKSKAVSGSSSSSGVTS